MFAPVYFLLFCMFSEEGILDVQGFKLSSNSMSFHLKNFGRIEMSFIIYCLGYH